jgi:hypothetical protein
MEIDTIEDIERKYAHNIKGVFNTLFKAVESLENKNIKCVPSIIVRAGEKIITEKDPQKSMLELVKGVIKNNCDNLIVDKNVSFFIDHWTIFTGENTNQTVVDIAKSIFEKGELDDCLIYEKIYTNKIFDYFYSAFKVSVKLVLLKSGVESMERKDDMVIYTIKDKVLDCCDGEVLSALIYKHKIRGIPTIP